MSAPARSSRRPRVVFVHPAIRPYRAHIYKALQERFDATFYVLGAPELNRRWASHYGIENLHVLDQGAFLAYRTNVSWAIAGHAWRDDYDVWIGSIMYAFSTHVAAPIVRARGRSFALWTEDWYWGGDRLSGLVTPYCRWILRHADLLLAAGTPQAAFLEAQGVARGRVSVAFNSFTPMTPSARVDRSGTSAHRPFRVLYLGRVLDYKGPQLLVRAYSRLERRYPGKTELHIVGQGPAEDECRRLVSQLDVRHVRFEGRLDPTEVDRAYGEADVFVHPCRWQPQMRVKGEAWGFVVNEAMSAGVPVITTTAVGAAQDLVRDGETGYVIAPDDEDALVDRLDRLFTDASLRHRMGEQARALIEKCFLPQMQASAFCDAVDALLEQKGRQA